MINPQWDYTANYVQLTWRRNVNRLGLKDVRMHDLRRTFGYNLIKQGRPIYEGQQTAWPFFSDYD